VRAWGLLQRLGVWHVGCVLEAEQGGSAVPGAWGPGGMKPGEARLVGHSGTATSWWVAG
jgi:hypothetical protein